MIMINDYSYYAAMMQYYDEVLAQSARNYAFTLEKKWKQRYMEVEPLLDKMLKTIIKDSDPVKKDFFSKMDKANQNLVKMELISIELVDNNKPKQAIALLENKEYKPEREIFTKGLKKFLKDYNEIESKIITKPIKDIIELERHLAILETRLKEKEFTIIGHFATRMAHDLRNPLSIIRVTVENLKILHGTDAKKQPQYDKIDRSIDRISHQVDDVLNFVMKHPVKATKTTTQNIIHESLDSITLPNSIKLLLPKNNVELICDKKQLAIVLNNLILNGIQAIDRIGTIEIIVDENNDGIIIQVKDSGSGIPKENFQNLFEPLFTTKPQGTGLGLASVKSIIDKHGGKISVSSPPTIFTITLPKIIHDTIQD